VLLVKNGANGGTEVDGCILSKATGSVTEIRLQFDPIDGPDATRN
jgi:hypothetical protein